MAQINNSMIRIKIVMIITIVIIIMIIIIVTIIIIVEVVIPKHNLYSCHQCSPSEPWMTQATAKIYLHPTFYAPQRRWGRCGYHKKPPSATTQNLVPLETY